MSDNSNISWTDASWNPVTGCDRVSPGCAHCYALTFAERFRGVPGHYFEHGFDVQLRPDKLDLPLRWRKPRRVFVNSMSDLFHESVPDEYIDRVFAVMALTPWHTYQVLTKRPERMLAYMTSGRSEAIGEVSYGIGDGATQLATLAKVKKSGGTFGTYLSRLKQRGLIDEQDGRVSITDDALDLVGRPAQPQSHEEFIDAWRAKLSGGALRMFDQLREASYRGMTREELAQHAEVAITGGTFGTYLSRLRTNGLIEEREGLVYATDLVLGDA